MYVRVASFEGGSSERLRELNEERIESGELIFPEGMSRAMVLVDPDSERRLFITFFESRGAIDAAAEHFERMGDDIPESARGKRRSVDVYEIAFDRAIEPETGWARPAGTPSASPQPAP